MSWLLNHQRAFRLALLRLLQTPFATLFTLLVVGLALSLPSAMYVGLKNLNHWLGHLPISPEISVFTQTDDPAALRTLEQSIRGEAGVSAVRLIRREDALKTLAQQLNINDLVDGLARNPLPHTLVVTLGPDTPPDRYSQLQQKFAALPTVLAVQYDAALNQKLHALRQLVANAALGLGFLLAIAITAVVANTIRLQILTQRDEIEVSMLIGATDAYIRRPFMYFGLLQGLLGGLTALLLLAGFSWLTQPYLAEFTQSYGNTFIPQSLSLSEAIALPVCTAALASLSAHIAAMRHLHRMRPSL